MYNIEILQGFTFPTKKPRLLTTSFILSIVSFTESLEPDFLRLPSFYNPKLVLRIYQKKLVEF